MIIFYCLCVCISILMLVWLHISDVRQSINQYIMMIVMIVSNFGYLSLAYANNLQEALLANKLCYLGGCFLPMLYFFTVCEVCHVKMRKKYVIVMALLQTAVFLSVCTIGISNLYYSDVQFVITNGVGALVKEYGPLHKLYPVTMYGYYLASLIVGVYAIRKKKSVHNRYIESIIFFSGMAGMCYILQRVVTFKYEIMPASYLILMLGTLYPLYKSNLFTVHENRDIIDRQLDKIGFVTFDKNLRYMGCNGFMIRLFPELKDCHLGRSIVNYSAELNNNILESVSSFIQQIKSGCPESEWKNKINAFEIREHFYEGTIHVIKNFMNQCAGYTVELRDETEHYNALSLYENYNVELVAEVNDKTKRIRDIQEKTILGMAQMVESRDLSTGGHVKRTTEVVKIFCRRLLDSDLKLDADFLNLVIRSASMHDLGKIGVDDSILRKQGKFTDEEYEKMKAHSKIGARMVSEILTGVEEEQFVNIAENVAHYHHEKVNGKGYPEGLVGNQIPIEARIMALADVFDALVSKRCYKEAFSYDKAFSIIQEDSGTHFDATLAAMFIECRSELEAYYEREKHTGA